MQGFEDTKEQTPQQHLAVFFDTLPRVEAGATYRIPRQEIDSLIEKGVSVEMVASEFVRRGYFIHGSAAGVARLEPRQSLCLSGDPDNCQTGVYGSILPSVSLFHAIKGQGRGVTGTSIHTTEEDGIITHSVQFEADHVIPEDTKGFVYILPGDTFARAGDGGQFVSPVAVVPAYVIEVERKDFMHPIEFVSRTVSHE
jgi:hypothetical protein